MNDDVNAVDEDVKYIAEDDDFNTTDETDAPVNVVITGVTYTNKEGT